MKIGVLAAVLLCLLLPPAASPQLSISVAASDPGLLRRLYGPRAPQEATLWTAAVRNNGASPVLLTEASLLHPLIRECGLRVVPDSLARRRLRESYRRTRWMIVPRLLPFAADQVLALAAFDAFSLSKTGIGAVGLAAQALRALAGYVTQAAPQVESNLTTTPAPWPEIVRLDPGETRLLPVWTIPYTLPPSSWTYSITVPPESLPHAGMVGMIDRLAEESGLTWGDAARNLAALAGERE